MYKLVITDDELEIRQGLRNYFPWESLGFEVVKDFSNGKELLEYVENHPVDVIISDIRMPFLSGIELAKTIYEKYPQITLIFLSGYRDFDYAKQAISYGVKHYIVKPTKYSELFEIFTKLKENLDKKIIDKDSRVYNYYNDILSKVKLYVQKNISEASLVEAAQLVNLSPNYLSKIFKEQTNTNFSKYLLDTKMLKAKELLQNIHYKTYEISSMLGYKNPKNFTRTFKKHFGCSPKEYRNNPNQR